MNDQKAHIAKLYELATSLFSGVRTQVLNDPDCVPEIFELLSKDADAYVRFCVASHKRCPENTLINLFCDKSAIIKRTVIRNLNCPEWIKVLES